MRESRVHQRRYEAVRDVMRDHGLELALLDGPENVAYLTGYTPPTAMYQACLASLSAGPTLVVRGNNRSRAESQAWCERVESYRDWDDPIDVLAGLLPDASGHGRIGKDMTSMVMTESHARRLAGLAGKFEWEDLSPDIDRLRAVKGPDELDLHRRAASIADSAALVGIREIAQGRPIAEAGLRAHTSAREQGADDRRTVVARPETPDPRAPGATVAMIELVPAVAGYDARLIRSVAIGPPSGEQLEMSSRVVEIQDGQIESMVPGAKASDVDALCRERMIESGLRASYEGLSGHGLGFTWAGNTTDTTWAMTPMAEWTLESGMIFHMYTRGGGFVIGDTILVTDDGPERLTKLDRRLHDGEGTQ